MSSARLISRHAIARTCIWVRGDGEPLSEKLAYIYELDGLQALVRVHNGRDWSEMHWMSAMDGPILGTPPADYAEAFKVEAAQLPIENPPPRPKAVPEPAQSRRQRPTDQLSLL